MTLELKDHTFLLPITLCLWSSVMAVFHASVGPPGLVKSPNTYWEKVTNITALLLEQCSFCLWHTVSLPSSFCIEFNVIQFQIFRHLPYPVASLPYPLSIYFTVTCKCLPISSKYFLLFFTLNKNLWFLFCWHKHTSSLIIPFFLLSCACCFFLHVFISWVPHSSTGHLLCEFALLPQPRQARVCN